MNPIVLEYLRRQISLGERKLQKYIVSPRGERNRSRNMLIRLEKKIRDFRAGQYSGKRWVIIAGLRGTGKTTIMAQMFDKLWPQRDKINLLYFSLDEAITTLGLGLQDVLSGYEAILGESYEILTRPTFIFIDEVQSDKNWASILKSLNDRTSNLFLICSGSSAVHLQDSADVSGRRADLQKLYPLNFCEFELIRWNLYPDKGLKEDIQRALYHSETAEVCYQNLKALEQRVNLYWSRVKPTDWTYYLGAGNLPFALGEENLQSVYDSILTSVDKVISTDIQLLGKFQIETIPVIKRILFILAESDAISVRKLASVLNITTITINNILETLVQAELLIAVPPKGAQINAANKPTKYLFMSPAIRAAYFNIAGNTATEMVREGRLLEDLIGLHLYREFSMNGAGYVTYDPASGGADFILQLPSSKIAIEVGGGQKGGRQAEQTAKEVKAKYGLSICADGLKLSSSGLSAIVPYNFIALA